MATCDNKRYIDITTRPVVRQDTLPALTVATAEIVKYVYTINTKFETKLQQVIDTHPDSKYSPYDFDLGVYIKYVNDISRQYHKYIDLITKVIYVYHTIMTPEDNPYMCIHEVQCCCFNECMYKKVVVPIEVKQVTPFPKGNNNLVTIAYVMNHYKTIYETVYTNILKQMSKDTVDGVFTPSITLEMLPIDYETQLAEYQETCSTLLTNVVFSLKKAATDRPIV